MSVKARGLAQGTGRVWLESEVGVGTAYEGIGVGGGLARASAVESKCRCSDCQRDSYIIQHLFMRSAGLRV